MPDSYRNLDDAYAEPPVQNPDEEPIAHVTTREDELKSVRSHDSRASREARLARRRSYTQPVQYDVPDAYSNLDELSVSPVENPDEGSVYEHHSLEQTRSQPVADEIGKAEEQPPASKQPRVSRLATQIYTLSYLVFFAILGTLARLGLSALTDYAGAPVIFSSIWPNFAGCIVMGFLAEDRMLFLFEWGDPTYENQIQAARRAAGSSSEPNSSGSSGTNGINGIDGINNESIDLAAAKKAHMATKKTIPLYIGLATGFCGSFTSFSAFIRDMFLALANNLEDENAPRNGGYSFMAVMAVLIITVSLSLSGFFLGAHLAIISEPIIPSLPYPLTRKVLDRLAILLGWGCWLGAILLSILPPDRDNGGTEIWRGRATFSLVFAPLGCLARFYASLYLNGRIASFPLGTFAVNLAGTMILGMSWDLAHVPLGGVIGCQVLQGIEDGFCGCLTTISTWAGELIGLRRAHAYFYGGMSILSSLAAMVAIMGGLRWTDGFASLQCTH